MKLAAWSGTRRRLAVTPLVGLLLTGCKSWFEPPRIEVRTATQIEVLRVAGEDYDVAAARPPRDTVDRAFPPGHSVPDSEAPTMTIATMTLKAGHSATYPRLLALIRSDREFPPMGIRRGVNFVWRDASGAHWITPFAPGSKDYMLQPTPGYQFPPRPEHEPSLLRVTVNSIAFVACLDDCPSGHCGMY